MMLLLIQKLQTATPLLGVREDSQLPFLEEVKFSGGIFYIMIHDFEDFIDCGSEPEEKSDEEGEITAPAKVRKSGFLDKLDEIF